MDMVFAVLQLVGSLALFLFGMKMMSDGLQKVAGDRMRSILSAMTSNPLKRVLTGLLVTTVIQSSSATTVMIVSFVNAGLLTLTQSIGVIMGANIGTTITAWLITLFGFKFDIAVLAIPFLAVGFIFLMLKSGRKKSIGEFIIGFSLLFLGLSYLKDSIPMSGDNPPAFFEMLKDYSNAGIWSVLLFVAVGTVLTIVLQSSSATMALTLVMCNNGWIPFEAATAMVLGENIGTTITANIAAAVANVSAKRAARAHFLFNIIGVLWMLAAYQPFLHLIDYIIVSFNGTSPFITEGNNTSILIGLAMFHTLFNVVNTCLLIGFTPLLVKAVTRMVPQKAAWDEAPHLQYISSGMIGTDELSLAQAKQEIALYAERTIADFEMIKMLYKETGEEKFNELFRTAERNEEVSDQIELEIATYLNQVSEGDLSELGRRRIQAMYRIISEIESINDSCYNMARTLNRRKDFKVTFTPALDERVAQMYVLLDKALQSMKENLEQGYENIVDISESIEYENTINALRNLCKDEHLKALDNNDYDYLTGVVYMDFILETEKMGDYIVNVSEAIMKLKHGL